MYTQCTVILLLSSQKTKWWFGEVSHVVTLLLCFLLCLFIWKFFTFTWPLNTGFRDLAPWELLHQTQSPSKQGSRSCTLELQKSRSPSRLHYFPSPSPLEKLFNCCGPQFPHLQNLDTNISLPDVWGVEAVFVWDTGSLRRRHLAGQSHASSVNPRHCPAPRSLVHLLHY